MRISNWEGEQLAVQAHVRATGPIVRAGRHRHTEGFLFLSEHHPLTQPWPWAAATVTGHLQKHVYVLEILQSCQLLPEEASLGRGRSR